MFVDSDDIILKSGIRNAYNYIYKYNLDMIQFHSVFEYRDRVFINRRYYKYSDIIYQPILSHIFYYERYNGCENNTVLWDKLIKKNIVMKSLNYIGKKYLKERIIIENDVILLFSVFQNCGSYQYIDQIAYYYVRFNNDSITNIKYNNTQADELVHSIFTNIVFLYEKTGNSIFDKYFCIFKLMQGYKRYNKYFKYLKKEFNYVVKILNKLLSSKYISKKNKLLIFSMKFSIIELKSKNNSYNKITN